MALNLQDLYAQYSASRTRSAPAVAPDPNPIPAVNLTVIGSISELEYTGAIDGLNKTFTLGTAPAVLLLLFKNGIRQAQPGDFTLAGKVITMVDAPAVGDTLAAVGG